MGLLDIARRTKARARCGLGPLIYWGRARLCPVCGNRLRRFQPLHPRFARASETWGFPFAPREFETLNLDEYACPICCEADRGRLIALWVRHWLATRTSSGEWRLLDFAPGKPLTRYLRSLPGIVYRSADRYMAGVDDQVDITQLPYPDAAFDAFICSHVLEHVRDDVVALRQLHRVLRPGGWGALLVPIPLGLKVSDEETADEATTASEAIRWRRFGQGDHVRLYARSDFIGRIRSVGFTCREFGIADLGAETFRTCGLTPTSTLYIVGKD